MKEEENERARVCVRIDYLEALAIEADVPVGEKIDKAQQTRNNSV